jgi:very-short-patch-repair endonuclease
VVRGLTWGGEGAVDREKRMRDTSPAIEGAARRLRKEMTPAEQRLWKALRNYQQDRFYFRRQHPIGRFVTDFCCTSRMLCVEVDGGIHDEQQERDAERTAYLEAKGYRVLRFRNEEVLNALHLVVRKIQAALADPPSASMVDPSAANRSIEAGPGLLDIPPPDSWE